MSEKQHQKDEVKYTHEFARDIEKLGHKMTIFRYFASKLISKYHLCTGFPVKNTNLFRMW